MAKRDMFDLDVTRNNEFTIQGQGEGSTITVVMVTIVSIAIVTCTVIKCIK